ncbi:tetratricopeptide repeat protein [Streptomyces sp. NPDC055078]
MTADPLSLRQSLRDNYDEPEGPARNARAERIFAGIEQAGDTELLIDGLNHLMQVYNYSSEADRMFVPFARLLRLWDERPGDFDGPRTHSLFWMFKWVSSGMIDQPHIPLAAIEKWQAEMEHRYRLAGHSERAVRQGELRIARHIGDLARARRAYTAWQAAERDGKSDCRACELRTQGTWQAHLGGDEEALTTWRPVLNGEFSCAHEPHAVLSASLLPLLRLGREDEARAHHLRGYRLVRPNESMRAAVAQHVEFCALTGNEARGLEILAERPAYFTDTGEPSSLLDHLAVTALLTGRLTALGHGERGLAGPGGRTWTARELAAHARREALALAARFDERNGTSYVSERVRERMDREPLLDRLPLGLRTGRPAAPARTAPAPAPTPAHAPSSAAAAPATDLASLLAEARGLSREQRPDAVEAWSAVAAAADREGGGLDALALAQLAEHRGMDRETSPTESVTHFRAAAEHYESAGEPGLALVTRARAAYVLASENASAERYAQALAEVLAARAGILARHTEGTAGAHDVSRVLLSRSRVLNTGIHLADDPEAAVGELAESVRELLAFAEPHRADPGVGVAIGEGLGFLGDIAAFRGEAAEGAALYRRAAEAHHRAGRPWYAVEVESRLAAVSRRLGDPEAAEQAARAALEHAGEYADAAGRCRLHLQLAECLADADRPGRPGRSDKPDRPDQLAAAAEHALQAAHWADEAGQSTGIGAYARHKLGGFLLRLGRVDEGAVVLEAVLPDLSADDHGDGMIVQTLWWLGDCLTALKEPRGAAEQWLKAADIAREWPEQHDHAMLANLAAEALYRAELNSEAELAYRRAGELWRGLGETRALVRTLRVRAWIALREGQAGEDAARGLMASAAGECAAALSAAAVDADADADASPEFHDRLLAELADTHRQTGELISNTVQGPSGPATRAAYAEAMSYAEKAIAEFAEAGEPYARERARAELLAGWLAAELDDPAAAGRRARGVLGRFTDESLIDEAEALLRYVTPTDPSP